MRQGLTYVSLDLEYELVRLSSAKVVGHFNGGVRLEVDFVLTTLY